MVVGSSPTPGAFSFEAVRGSGSAAVLEGRVGRALGAEHVRVAGVEWQGGCAVIAVTTDLRINLDPAHLIPLSLSRIGHGQPDLSVQASPLRPQFRGPGDRPKVGGGRFGG